MNATRFNRPARLANATRPGGIGRAAWIAVTALCLIGIGAVATQSAAQSQTAADPRNGTAPPDMVNVQVSAEALLADEATTAREQEITASVQAFFERAQASGQGFGVYAGMRPQRISLRQAALAALDKNLNIRRSKIAERIARQAKREAAAAFEPVFTLSFDRNAILDDERIEQVDKFRRATVLIDGLNAIPFTANPVVRALTFTTPRPAGRRPARETAHEAPIDVTRITNILGLNLSQKMPWGASVVLGFELKEERNRFILAGVIQRTSFGQYNKDWSSRSSINLQSPFPFTKNFGRLSDADVAIDLRKLEMRNAFWVVGAVINDILLSVENRYWDLVGAVQRVKARSEVLALVEDLMARTDRLFELQQITLTSRAQIAGELARVKGEAELAFAGPPCGFIPVTPVAGDPAGFVPAAVPEEVPAQVTGVGLPGREADTLFPFGVRQNLERVRGAARSSDLARQLEISRALEQGRPVDCQESFVTASDRLRQLLDLDEPVLFLPGGFLSIMEAPQVDVNDARLVLDNPDYRSAVIKVKSAELIRDVADNRTLPDLSLSTGFESTQFNSKYGFDDLERSVNWVFSNPDSKSFSAGIAYQRVLRNRAAEAALVISERDLEIRGLDLRDIENELDRDFRKARIRLSSALEQIKITQRNQELAQSVVDRAARFQQLRKVTEFEIVQNLRDLLTAKNRHVDARINLRYAEAALLNSAGLLAERFGERTSQSDYDRERLKVLAQSGMLRHFGKVQ